LRELFEQLTWLGAAFQRAPEDGSGIWLATPFVKALQHDSSDATVPSINFEIRYDITKAPKYSESNIGSPEGACWHAMFHNPVVVQGFPILARQHHEIGLEVPLNMMSALASAGIATQYDKTLILKGFHSMLVPTKREGDDVTWHLMVTPGGRLPYYSFREKCGVYMNTDHFSIHELRGGTFRNFVGWTTNITRHFGTWDSSFGSIDWAGTRKCSAGFAVEQKLTISASRIVGASASFIRGNRDKPEYVKQSAYSLQIEAAQDMFVMLYDTSSERGWLVDRASALLHLALAQLSRKPYIGVATTPQSNNSAPPAFTFPDITGGPDAASHMLTKVENMKHVVLQEFDSYTETVTLPHNETSSKGKMKCTETSTAQEEKRSEEKKEVYKTICFREVVSQVWTTLEQLHDRETDLKTNHATIDLESPFNNPLEGYEFMDIASGKHKFSRRFLNLRRNGKSWIHLIRRLGVITLFGKNFGEMYQPGEDLRSKLCPDWKTVPQGHEYLALPISLLQQIKEYGRREGEVDDGSSEVVQGLYWNPNDDMSVLCTPKCKHTFDGRVQILSTKGKNVNDATCECIMVQFHHSSLPLFQSCQYTQRYLQRRP
jgi:hypothetical protein